MTHPMHQDYKDAVSVGAYLMFCIIRDNLKHDLRGAEIMKQYTALMARALACVPAQLAVDIADQYERTFTGKRRIQK